MNLRHALESAEASLAEPRTEPVRLRDRLRAAAWDCLSEAEGSAVEITGRVRGDTVAVEAVSIDGEASRCIARSERVPAGARRFQARVMRAP